MSHPRRFLAIACLRNEASGLLDWIAHHKAVGFTDFLFYSNDCADGTNEMLDRLAAQGMLQHRPNPGPYKGGVQFTAMKLAAREPVYQAADWVMALDLDEYLNVHAGDRRLDDLVSALPDAAAISVTWRMFGNDGRLHFEPGAVTEHFTKAAPEVMFWPWRAFMFKTLFRPDAGFQRPGIHRPHRKKDSEIKGSWYDSQGRVMPVEFTETTRPFAYFGQPQYALAQINHYALQSAEAFLVKSDRGRAVHADQSLGVDYWIERNWNDVDDRSISFYAADTARERERLFSDAEIVKMHHKAVDWRLKRIRELLLDEQFRELFGQLAMAPASRVLPKEVALRLHSYGRLTRKSSQ